MELNSPSLKSFLLDRKKLWEMLEYLETDMRMLHIRCKRRKDHPVCAAFLKVKKPSDWGNLAVVLKGTTPEWKTVLAVLMNQDIMRTKKQRVY